MSVVDRLALHVGIALIRWGRRPSRRTSYERRARRWEQYLARAARERAIERSTRLQLPPR